MNNPLGAITSMINELSEEPEPQTPDPPAVGAEVYIISILEGIVIFIICAYVLHGFTDHKRSSLTTQVIILISWFLSFSIIVFIPLDLYLTHYDVKYYPTASTDGQLFYWWTISYWSSYIINWFVIPLFQGYELAGEFEVS